MRHPNPVQSVPQLPQFQRPPAPPVEMGQQHIQESCQDLALEIYARLAARYLGDDHYSQPMSHEHLRQLAKHAQAAATAYYESLGVRFDSGAKPG
jgi:hypothetical protein